MTTTTQHDEFHAARDGETAPTAITVDTDAVVSLFPKPGTPVENGLVEADEQVEVRGLPLLVGISGKKRMGKDTLASQLIMDHGFKRFAIADAIKQMAVDIDPWMVNAVTGQPHRLSEVLTACGGTFEGVKANPGWDTPVREFLQGLGGHIALKDPTFWPRPTIQNALTWIEETGNGATVPDVRFPWEVDMIRAAGGVVIRVCRSDRPDSEQTDPHLSETALDDLSSWEPEYVFDTTPLSTMPERAAVMVERFREILEGRQQG